MTTLEDLYYGNISPHERYIKRGTRVDKIIIATAVSAVALSVLVCVVFWKLAV